MSKEKNKQAIANLVEAVSMGNIEILDRLAIANLLVHNFGRGREPLKNLFNEFRNAFPNATFTIEQIFAEQDKVMSYVTVSGTHKGEWLGAAATGEKIIWTASAIARFDNDKIVEIWAIEDQLGIMQQLGVATSIGG